MLRIRIVSCQYVFVDVNSYKIHRSCVQISSEFPEIQCLNRQKISSKRNDELRCTSNLSDLFMHSRRADFIEQYLCCQRELQIGDDCERNQRWYIDGMCQRPGEIQSRSEEVEVRLTKVKIDLHQFNPDDGLPQKMCTECAAALEAAFVYKRKCERSDVTLRRYFKEHLNSVRVKIERIGDGNESIRPLEENRLDDIKLEVFDECSYESASDNCGVSAMPRQGSGDSETNVSTLESISVPQKSIIANSRQTKRKMNLKTRKVAKCDDNLCENGRLKCEICNLSFLNGRTLKNHLRRQSHLNRYNRLHGADVVKISRRPVKKIKKKITERGDEDGDVKIAERAQCVDGRFVCEFCNNTFSERTSLKFHLRIHLGVNMRPCGYCDRAFSRESYRRQHIKNNHSNNSPCSQCDLVFNSKLELREHTIQIHTQPKPEKSFSCEICSRTFNRMNNLNEHRLTHSAEKKFTCDICQRKYGGKRGLKWVRICYICYLFFIVVESANFFRDHMRTHGDKSNYYHLLCSHCGKKFASSSHMAKHVRHKHSTIESFKCEYCGKGKCNRDIYSMKQMENSPVFSRSHSIAFLQDEALKKHILKHLDRFTCKVCGKSLSTKFRLISHTR